MNATTPWITALLAVAGGLVLAGRTDNKAAASLLAGLGALLLIGFAVLRNRRFWQGAPVSAEALFAAGAENSLALTLAYGWGALAMLGYYLTPIKWYHPWQYGGAMAILAVLWLRDVPRLRTANPAFDRARLARQVGIACIAQGIAAAAGVAVLLLSGKLFTERGDWLANRIFIAGGVAVAVISAITVVTHRRLCRTAD